MKITLSVIVIAMLVLSFNAQAAEMWKLVHSELHGNSYMCTYQSGSYQMTIRSNYCEYVIYR